MSRQIKFRAWCTFECGFVDMEDTYIEIETGKVFTRNGFAMNKLLEIDTAIIMQYTGLTDKNGVAIYEGDIVEWDDNSNGKWRRRCEVTWVKAHYKLVGYWYDINKLDIKTPTSFKFGAFIYEDDGELEIIGNIYNNPELIKLND